MFAIFPATELALFAFACLFGICIFLHGFPPTPPPPPVQRKAAVSGPISKWMRGEEGGGGGHGHRSVYKVGTQIEGMLDSIQE